MTLLERSGILHVAGHELEFKELMSEEDAPTIVMLHEGLGCVGLWLDFPERIAEATGARVFVYSRAGYGQSSPVPLPRPLTYMHEEARQVLPALLDEIGFEHGILLGHSDGASIAAIYAGSFEDPRLAGISLIAPHFVVEDISVSSIAEAKTAYETTDLRAKLSRWHKAVDVAFRGWNDAWLDPAFRDWDISGYLPEIDVPVQIVQGEADQYGTTRQLDIALERCGTTPEIVLMPGVKHAPHREAAEQTVAVVSAFCNRVFP